MDAQVVVVFGAPRLKAAAADSALDRNRLPLDDAGVDSPHLTP